VIGALACISKGLRLLPPETAHRVTLRALQSGLVRGTRWADDPRLATQLWGLPFLNPVGLSAGFDKDAQVILPCLRLGFGFVEVGSITPLPQAGNPPPRVFRLPEDGAVINRLGFNSGGHAAALARLHRVRQSPLRGPIGVNLGKNRDSSDPVADYALGASRFAPVADYLVVNLSSPNTPGLRDLQEASALAEIVAAVRAARDGACPANPPPLLVKLAPDLLDAQVESIVAVAEQQKLDGLVISNTTVARPPGLHGRAAQESGGLSGRPLFAPSTALLRRIFALTGGLIPLIGVGGIASGADAYAKIRAGASLVQLYTALIYQGPDLVRRINRDLAALLQADGFGHVAQAVGADHRAPPQ
jgi:dihydroorotate dehydrogenase